MGDISGILFHRLREWPACPVCLLRSFHERDAKELLHQRRQTELGDPDQTRGNNRVENFFCDKTAAAPQKTKIEIHSLQDDFLFCEHAAKRLQIERRKRVDEKIAIVETELDQAEFFEIAMQAIGLGIDCDPFDRSQAWKELRELCVRCDHRRPASSSSAFVLVACRLLINNSIASSGGRAAMVFRKSFTRSHSSG